jgi:hypothetical protein
MASVSVADASAAASLAPSLTLRALAVPSHFSAADNAECLAASGDGGVPPCDGYQVTLTNSGTSVVAGPLTLTDTLPAGLSVRSVALFWAENRLRSTLPVETSAGWPLFPEEREGKPTSLCETSALPTRVTCEFPPQVGTLRPDQRLQMDVYVTVTEGADSGEVSSVSVLEAGAAVADESVADVLSAIPPAFGPSGLFSELEGAGGRSAIPAGSHPYGLAAGLDLDSRMGVTEENTLEAASVDQLRDLVVDLPLGIVGNPSATAKCTFGQLQSLSEPCPLDTLVGHISSDPHGLSAVNAAVYNMVPEHGVAAEFGYADLLHGTHAIVAGVAPTPAGYVLRAIAREVPQVALTDLLASVYGDPAAQQQEIARLEGEEPLTATPSAMLTSPSDCSGESLKTTVHVDSWQQPGTFNPDGTPNVEEPGSHGWVSLTSEAPPVSGCDALRFAPDGFSVQPETSAADSPTGLSVDLRVPQSGSERPEVLATPPLRDAVVSLPAGLAINLSAAGGLQACSEAQIGWLGPDGPHGEVLPNRGLTNFTEAAPTCPEASKVGTVEVETPMLEGPLEGAVYLASQYENPFGTPGHPGGSLLAGYVVIEDPARGIVVKLAGNIALDQATGQVTGTFDEDPQLPFSDLKLRFSGGPRAKLVTPEGCGTFTTSSVLTPWSAPQSGPPATPSSSFAIASGAGGAACPSGGAPFAPAFTAGTTSSQAGATSPFTLVLSRQDSEQDVSAFALTTPPGLLPALGGVPTCPEAQAGRGECPAASQLGSATVAAGAGSDPLYLGGTVYLTGPYDGAPYGLAIVVPARTGPFDLGNVVIRATVSVDPATLALTIATGRLPQLIDGIPLRLRTVYVDIDRPGFFSNPTNCAPLALTATVTGAQGASAPESSPFQAVNCATLKFAPRLTAVTRANGEFSGHGASLHMAIASPAGQANLRSLKLDLPRRLPARLETIQQACRQSVFDANPAACPAASVVGAASVRTPVLAGTLAGPVYLVAKSAAGAAHAGESRAEREEAAFPDLVLVLQGPGIRVDLTGGLFVSKANVTSVTFRSLPDVPIRRLELVLPEGHRSILVAGARLCGKRPLRMLTAIAAQNGARLKPTVAVAVEGCGKRRRPSIERR